MILYFRGKRTGLVAGDLMLVQIPQPSKAGSEQTIRFVQFFRPVPEKENEYEEIQIAFGTHPDKTASFKLFNQGLVGSLKGGPNAKDMSGAVSIVMLIIGVTGRILRFIPPPQALKLEPGSFYECYQVMENPSEENPSAAS